MQKCFSEWTVSYILARLHSTSGSEATAALLLIRVCREISHFPAHAASILTSAVIACQRAGYHKSALDFAAQAVRPEYRSALCPEYKRKIENLVRKPDRTATDPVSVKSMCLRCGIEENDEMQLSCARCAADLPFCIGTGQFFCSLPSFDAEFRAL